MSDKYIMVTAYSDASVLPALPGYQTRPSLNCVYQSTEWSACSRTCGQGISTRVSNWNAACRLEKQIRLCKIRPCHALTYQTQVVSHDLFNTSALFNKKDTESHDIGLYVYCTVFYKQIHPVYFYFCGFFLL